jgi:hypothetical protein
MFWAVVALSALAVPGPAEYWSLQRVGAAAAAVQHDFLALLGLRSPGARLSDILFQSKGPAADRTAARPSLRPGAGEAPTERVLALVRERPPEPGDALGPSHPLITDSAGPALPGGFGVAPTGFGVPGAPVYGPVGLAGPYIPQTSGGPPGSDSPPTTDTPGGPPAPPIPPSTPVTTPIPEPNTWAMMIVGVFGVGALLRRSRAKRILPAE